MSIHSLPSRREFVAGSLGVAGLTLMTLNGCLLRNREQRDEDDDDEDQDSDEAATTEEDATDAEDEFTDTVGEVSTLNGTSTYVIPDGLALSQRYSTDTAYCFVREGEEYAEQPDNISVQGTTMDYPMDEADAFADYVQSVLEPDVGEGETLSREESQTDAGDPLYIFSFTGVPESRSIQYYCVGDYEFVLFNDSCPSEDAEFDAMAEQMARSFVWA
jgi:hypothetical protein